MAGLLEKRDKLIEKREDRIDRMQGASAAPSLQSGQTKAEEPKSTYQEKLNKAKEKLANQSKQKSARAGTYQALRQEEEKKLKPWQTATPFAEDYLNEKFQALSLDLFSKNTEQRTKNPMEAAYGIISNLKNNALTAFSINGGKDPFPAAEKIMQEEVDKARGAFAAEGKSATELEKLLNQSGIRQTQETDTATPEEKQRRESRAKGYDRINEIVNAAFKAGSIYGLSKEDQDIYHEIYGDTKGEKLLKEYERAMLQGGDAYIQKAQELYQYGKDRAQRIRNGEPEGRTPEQEAYWEAYISTPEGAAQWMADAQGTKEEQKARDNEYMVSRKARYEAKAAAPDFAAAGKVKEDFKSGDGGFDRIYNIINNLNNAAGNEMMAALSGGRANEYLNYNRFMSDEEKAIFNAYANEGAIDEAKQYLDYLSYAINERMAGNASEAMQSIGEDGLAGGIAASAASVPLSVSRGVGYIDQLAQNVRNLNPAWYKPVDRNTGAMQVGRMADALRQGVQNQVDWDVNILGQDVDVFDFLYGTAMSGIDSLAAGKIGAALGGIAGSAEKAKKIAEWTGAAILGTGAAQSAMQEVYDRGGSNGTALFMGTLAGANETIWEHISLGRLFKESNEIGYKKTGEKLVNILKEAGVNFTEEFNTTVANGLGEYIFNHDERDVQQKADAYERLGLSKEEAMAKAKQEFWVGAVMDGVGGALMGGAFGAIENSQSTRYTKQVDKALGHGFAGETMDSLYKAAEADKKSEAAKIAAKYPKEKATARQVGELARAVLTSNSGAREMKDAIRGTVQADIALQIAQNSGVMDRRAAEAVTAMLEGKALTNEQVAALAGSRAGMEITRAIFGGDARAEGAAPSGKAEGKDFGAAIEPVEMEAPPGIKMPEAMPHQPPAAAASPARGSLGNGETRIDVETVARADKGKGAQKITDIAENEDGSVQVTLAGGEKIDLEDTGLTPDMQAAARAAAGMQDKEAAAALMNAAKEALGGGPSSATPDGAAPSPAGGRLLGAEAGNTASAAAAAASPQGEGQRGRDLALGFQKIYEAAKNGSIDAKTVYGEQLDAKTRRIAEDAGRKAAERIEAQAKERNAQEAKAAGFKTVEEAKGAAGVQFDHVGDALRNKDGSINQAKLNQAMVLDAFGKKTGIQYRLVDRLENDANGKYKRGTNIVYISLNAEGGGLTRAASHEGYHFIKNFSPDMAQTITQFVLDRLEKAEGYDLEARIKEVQKRYSDGAGQNLDRDGAIEEIVGDSMLDVIGTEDNLKALMQESKSAFEKITEWINNTYNRFKEILRRLADYSPEIKALKDDVEYIGRIRDMYMQAMEAAKEAYQQAQAGYNETAEALKNSEAVQQYRKEMEGDITPEDRENSLTAFLSRLFGETQKGWIQANMDKWEEGLEKFRQALLDYKQKGAALNVALARQGMDTVSGPDIRVLSYAAEQAARAEKERAENARSNGDKFNLRSKREGAPEDSWLLTPGEYSHVQTLFNQWKYEGKHYAERANGGILISIGNKLIVWADEYGTPERVLEIHAEDIKVSNDIYETFAIMEGDGASYADEQKALKRFSDTGNTHFRVPGEVKASRQSEWGGKGEATRRTGEGNRRFVSLQERLSRGEKLSLPYRQTEQADAADWVRDDAELFLKFKTDENARAALMMLDTLYQNTTGKAGNGLMGKADLEKRLPEMVKKFKQETGTTVTDAAMTKQLTTLYSALQKPGYQMGEMLQYAREMIQGWIERAPGVTQEMDETTRDILKALKHPFALTADQKSEIKGVFGDARDFYRKNLGKMKIRNGAQMTLSDLWMDELNKLNPGVFTADATEADMPIILDAWLETAGKREYNGTFGANIGAMSTDMAMNAILEFFNTPDILEAKYQMNKEQADRTYQLYQAAEQLIETVREGYKQKYDERIGQYKTTAEKQKKRDQIARAMRAINSMTQKPTDRRHVPKELQEMASQALDALLNGKSGFSKEKMMLLENEYSRLEGQKAEIAGWDEETLGRIGELAETLDGKSLKDLSLEELEELGKLVGNLHRMILDQNKAFIDGKEADIDHYSEQFGIEMEKKKEVSKGKAASAARGFWLKNTTATYFADQAGGVIKGLVNQLFKGQRTAYRVAEKGRGLLSALVGNYHVNDWINDKTQKEIVTEQGHRIRIDRRLGLELAALWNREINSGDTKSKHLRYGGFTYRQSAADRLKMDTTTAHRLTAGDMAQITAWLGDEQMGFMRAVVSMLSNEMGAEGNKVSLRLHGYEKFGEKNYFPYATDKRYMATELSNTEERTGQPKNKGFTKALTRNAVTPVSAGDFMDTVAGHINDMAIYCGFAEPADLANKIMNRRMVGETTETGEMLDAESNWVKMEKAMGKEAVSYMKTLYRDVGGGINAGERTPIGRGLSAFKKASVAGNISVWVQQPFAYLRAGAMVSPGYLTLALNPAKLKGYINRMNKYSEVAGIKKIGKFDTGTGKSMAQWIGDSVKDPSAVKRTMEKVDNITGIGAEKGDEWAWGFLWGAIEKEIAHTTDLKQGTDEFYRAVADRFEDVVNHTQVYDSVLSKSEYMRSKNEAIMMATSFMAEPTLSANMLADSIVRYNEKGMGAKQVARRAATFLFTALFTAMGKALPGAWRRKKDEGRTFGEKWLAEAVENFTYDISPAGLASMVPFARDAISLFEGYDVARSDMDAVEQITKALKTLQNEKATLEDKLQNTLGAVGNLFGIPIKNVWRDAEGIIRNLFLGESAQESRSGKAGLYTALESINFEPFNFWDSDDKAYYDRMEQALIKGDTAKYEELRGYMEETKRVKGDTISTEIKNELKESVLRGLVTEEKAVDLMVTHLGVKDEKTAYDQIDKYVQKKKSGGDEDFEYSKYADLMDAVKSGGDVEAEIKRMEERGNARKTVVGQIKTQTKDWYVSGEMTRAQAEKALKNYVGITDADNNALYWTLDEWDWLKANPEKTSDDYKIYQNIVDAVKSGNAQSIKAAVQKHLDHPHTKDQKSGVSSTITTNFKSLYIELWNSGKKTEAANLKAAILTAYEAAGYARDMKNKDIDKWLKTK